MLGRLPYLAYTCVDGSPWLDAELRAAGVERRQEVSTASFVVSPLLQRGTRLVALVQERLAKALQQAAELRILEPPLPLRPITETMFWHPRSEDDPAHRWLREELAALTASAIVNFSRTLTRGSIPAYAAGNAGNAAVEDLTLLLTRELRGRDITVNVVVPGPGIVEAVAFLAGPGRWINGQVIDANADLAMRNAASV